jgi:hypothetical protein
VVRIDAVHYKDNGYPLCGWISFRESVVSFQLFHPRKIGEFSGDLSYNGLNFAISGRSAYRQNMQATDYGCERVDLCILLKARGSLNES